MAGSGHLQGAAEGGREPRVQSRDSVPAVHKRNAGLPGKPFAA
jgi:hypothetical protein